MEQFQQLKNEEIWYYVFKCTSDSYTFQFSHKIGKGFVKAGELVCYAVYLNPSDNFKQWYTPYEKTLKEKQLSYWILLFNEGKCTINKWCCYYYWSIK